jgi:hypothetical protein
MTFPHPCRSLPGFVGRPPLVRFSTPSTRLCAHGLPLESRIDAPGNQKEKYVAGPRLHTSGGVVRRPAWIAAKSSFAKPGRSCGTRQPESDSGLSCFWRRSDSSYSLRSACGSGLPDHRRGKFESGVFQPVIEEAGGKRESSTDAFPRDLDAQLTEEDADLNLQRSDPLTLKLSENTAEFDLPLTILEARGCLARVAFSHASRSLLASRALPPTRSRTYRIRHLDRGCSTATIRTTLPADGGSDLRKVEPYHISAPV